MKRTTITFLMMFSTICCWTQTKDSIDTSNIVVTYNYTGHTTDKNGKKVDDHYRLAVLIGNKTTMGWERWQRKAVGLRKNNMAFSLIPQMN